MRIAGCRSFEDQRADVAALDIGAEFTFAWSFMLIAQALLGDGAYAVRVPALPWERGLQRA